MRAEMSVCRMGLLRIFTRLTEPFLSIHNEEHSYSVLDEVGVVGQVNSRRRFRQ